MTEQISQRDIYLGNPAASKISESVCVDFMELALDDPVSLDCPPNALPILQVFARARQCCQERGDHRFDGLTFQIGGFWLSIYWNPTGARRFHRTELEFFGEKRYLVLRNGIINNTE